MKLDAVQYYLECYANALTRAGMDIWYIDAFAGSGEREAERQIGGLFENQVIETITETLDGSARRAMRVEPPFEHFIFIEDDHERCAALEALKGETSRHVEVIRGEANSTLARMVMQPPWDVRDRGNSRGVIFLDPYSMQVDWTTLQALAQTKALDVWYLFPLEAVLRQLARSYSGVGPKAPMLDKVLSPAWRDLYSLPPPEPEIKLELFDTRNEEELRREASAVQIEEWFRKRLETIFAYVPEPVPILRSANRRMFSLFLCVSNPSDAATDLAGKFMKYVRKGRRPASRRMSGR